MSSPNTTSSGIRETKARAPLVAEQELAEPDRPGADQEFSHDEDFAEEVEAIPGSTRPNEALVALFTPEVTETYRSRWTSVQSSFVDDPRQAVRSGDELVAEIMTNLAHSFADERHRVEGQLDETGDGSTENLRLALRRYRSFFERLLSL